MKLYSVIIIMLLIISCSIVAQESEINGLSDLSLEELMRLEVITPGMFEQENWEATGKVYIITRETILDRGYNDLIDALRDIPYFQVQSEYGHWTKGAIINLRGHRSGDSGNNKFLILLDGTKLSDDAEEGLYLGLNSFPIRNVKQIEVVYGPNSTLYGRDAYAGMINIITRESEYAYAGFDYGTYNSKIIQGGINKNFTDDISGKVNFYSYKSDEQDPRDKSVDYLNRHIFPQQPFKENFYRASNNSMLHLGFDYSNLNLQYILFDLEGSETFGDNPDFYLTDYSTQTKLTNQILSADYNNNLTDWLSSDIHFFYKKYEMDPSTANLYVSDFLRNDSHSNADNKFDPLFGFGGRKYYYFRTTTYSAASKFVSRIYKNITNVSGMDFNFVYGIPVISEGKGGQPIVSKDRRKLLEHFIRLGGVFTEFTYLPYNNISVAFGGRVELNSRYENTFMPRVSINGKFGDHVLKLVFAKGFLAPSISQVYLTSITTFSYIKQNENLVPEKNTSYEFDWTFTSGNTRISANAFYNKLKDGIVESMPTGEFTNVLIGDSSYYVPVLMSQNVSNGERLGICMEISQHLFENALQLNANYSFTTGKDKIKQLDNSYKEINVEDNLISPHILNLNLLFKYSKLSLYASVQYLSKRRIQSHHITTLYADLLDDNGYLNFNSAWLTNINLRANKIFNGISLWARVNNLFNTEYYGQSITANWGSPMILQDLRRFLFGIEYNF